MRKSIILPIYMLCGVATSGFILSVPYSKETTFVNDCTRKQKANRLESKQCVSALTSGLGNQAGGWCLRFWPEEATPFVLAPAALEAGLEAGVAAGEDFLDGLTEALELADLAGAGSSSSPS
jgi:hypothetical protein